MKAIAALISPQKVEDFFAEFWAQKAILIQNQGSKDFNHLFSWEKLTYLLNFYPLKYPDLKLVSKSISIDREDPKANLIERCQEGATLIVNYIHKLLPELAEFTLAIAEDLGIGNKVFVNSYCSWPEKQGFDCHYDPHEVFIIQIDGTKKWHVFQDTHKYPLPSQTSNLFSPPEAEPYLTCCLNPGDVLYIPRGHWHYGVAQDRPSLHITLGIECRIGVDFLYWLVKELAQREEWRKNMPLIRGDDDSVAVVSYLDNLSEELFEFLALSDRNIPLAYKEYLASLEMPFEKISLPSQAGFKIFPQGIQTRFRILKFPPVKILELNDGEGCTIKSGNKQVDLQGVTSSFAENLFNRDSFTGSEASSWLAGYEWETVTAPLLSTLVRAGVILVDPNLAG